MRTRTRRFNYWFAPLLLLAVLFAVSPARALDAPPFDPQHKEVTDLAQLLAPTEITALVNKIRALQTSDGTQVAVLTIPTLDGDDIFEFTHRVATSWKIGQNKTDNGVLLVVVKNDRKVRIHVGYGLEGRLTDALSKRIILNEIQPRFRSGKYYEGIDNAVSAIIKAVKGEYTAPSVRSRGNGSSEGGFWFMLVMLAFFWIMGIRNSRRARGRRGRGGVVFLPGFGSGWSSGSSDGGWSSGSSSGGSDWGGGGGSFGGGDFGGGGASGDW
jgi:uncharacterized protein